LRSFNLLRYFTFASLLAIASTAVATAWTFSRNLERSLTEEGGLYAEDVARSLNRAIFESFLAPLAAQGREIDLADPSESAPAQIVGRVRAGCASDREPVRSRGTIISTNLDYVGYRSDDNPVSSARSQARPRRS
jgi:hypothetical protein